MRAATLNAAISEAARFLRKAGKLRDGGWRIDGHLDGIGVAAVKRASMDLTRALADLRQGR